MPSGTKRTLAELITLYELEPDLSEVITEGRTDTGVILWFLRSKGCNTAVYSVTDRLEVPRSEMKRRGENVGNRGRVVAAAQRVTEESRAAAERITFVYDMDEDVISGRSVTQLPCLLHTDYRSIELYCCTAKTIDKLLKVTLRADDDIKADTVLDTIKESLVELAFVRFVLGEAPEPIGIRTAIERRCTVKGDILTVDVRAVIADSIDDAGGPTKTGVTVDELMACQQSTRSACASDLRLVIHGHDFTRICCFYLKTRYPNLFKEDRAPYKVPKVFEVALLTCLELDQLASEELFKKLLKRHGSSKSSSCPTIEGKPTPILDE